jgi:hypothetical protein
VKPDTVYAIHFYHRKLYATLHRVQGGNSEKGWRAVIWTRNVAEAEKFADEAGAQAWADDMGFWPGSFSIVPVLPSFPGLDDPDGGTPALISLAS